MSANYFTNSSTVSSNRLLYTPSQFARISLLHLQEIGTLKALKEHTSKREGLQSFLFFTVLSGSGFLIYNGKRYELTAGDCVFIDCQRAYSHTTPLSSSSASVVSTPSPAHVENHEGMNGSNVDNRVSREDKHGGTGELWSLRWCHFYGPTAASIYSKYCERGGRPVFRPSDTQPYLFTLDKLEEQANGSDYMRDMLINQHLSELMVEVMRESWHPEEASSGAKKTSVIDVKAYIDQNYGQKITLDELSTHFFINKYYLTRVFKEQLGISINSYITAVRITHAKNLLRFSDKTIEEISLACGFGAAAYFSRIFKNVEGVAPSVYRSQW